MPATSVTEQNQPETVTDDVSNTEVKAPADAEMAAKLAALKAKSQAKQQEDKMAAKIVSRKEKSIILGILGSGQAGSRLAEAL